jgi:iron complex outermembrane recepter protein
MHSDQSAELRVEIGAPPSPPLPLARVINMVLAAAALAAVSTGTAWAQQQESTAPAAAASLETIEITARRLRPEVQTTATGLELTLVDTPQSISIVTPEMLRAIGATNIYQASDFIPGLQRAGSGYGLDRILLRGNQITGWRVNGTRFVATRSIEGLAMDRIEVVRGPATALYGVSGSFGGEINHILKGPPDSFYSHIGLIGGDFDRQEVEFDIGGPFGGDDARVGGRLLGLYRDYGAPVDVVDVDNNRQMVAGSLLFDVTESTQANIFAYYQKEDEDPYDGGFLQSTPDGDLQLARVPAKNWYFSDPRYSRYEADQLFVIGNVQHRLENDWRFKVQAAYTQVDTLLGEYFPFGPAGAYDLGDDEVYLYSYDQDQKWEDMTIDASLGGKFSALGREHQFFAMLEYASDISPTENLLYNSVYLGIIRMTEGGRGILSDGSPVPLVDRSTLSPRVRTEQGYRDMRGSLQLLLNATDKTDVLLGILYQDSEIDSTVLIRGGNVLSPSDKTSESYDKWVPRFGVTYSVAENRGPVDLANIYFSYSEGFSPNLGIRDEDGNPLTDPQEMTQYEIGLKAEMLRGALGASIAYFDSEATNIPVSVNFKGGFGGGAGSILQGRRDVEGVELEIIGQPRPEINVAFNYAYTTSKLSDPNYDFTAPVNNVPKNQAGLYASYEFQEGAVRGLSLGASVVYMGDFSYVPSLPNIERFGQLEDGGNTRIGLSAFYQLQADWARGLELYVIANNITDEKVYMLKEDHPGFGVTREYPKAVTFGAKYTFGR